MPMLDEMFNPGTYAPPPDLLAQMLAAPRPGGPPPPGWAPPLPPASDVGYAPGAGVDVAAIPCRRRSHDAGAEPVGPADDGSRDRQAFADLMARVAALEGERAGAGGKGKQKMAASAE
jgi:hypothetical protein